ncbi:hypothetical protein G9A89_006171 [Geosiphon pyriformis]|nr:hypothetical protein G9A89_006171 [Geosiphon pyriformis]
MGIHHHSELANMKRDNLVNNLEVLPLIYCGSMQGLLDDIVRLGIDIRINVTDFGTATPWELSEEEEEEELEDQEFTYQNSILKNPEFGTLNIQVLQNQNPKVINQHLPPVIIIDQPPQQQQMAYAPIAKLDKFTGKEDNAQVWLNDVEKAITANG